MLSEVRALLYNYQQQQQSAMNNVYGLLRLEKDSQGHALIGLGPTFDKGTAAEHFIFDSGARLSFGLTLQERGQGTRLLGYRVHYAAPEDKHPSFIRFDLNRAIHQSPLLEPMCHLHPGHDEIRLPSVPLDPVHVLELVLYVVDSQFQ